MDNFKSDFVDSSSDDEKEIMERNWKKNITEIEKVGNFKYFKTSIQLNFLLKILTNIIDCV